MNIIWHLFAGESHQVVKITVTYCAGHSVHVDAKYAGSGGQAAGAPAASAGRGRGPHR
jgi:hypothetical protein